MQSEQINYRKTDNELSITFSVAHTFIVEYGHMTDENVDVV